MTFVVVGGIWLVASALAAVFLAAVGRAGAWEDQQRGYDDVAALRARTGGTPGARPAWTSPAPVALATALSSTG